MKESPVYYYDNYIAILHSISIGQLAVVNTIIYTLNDNYTAFLTNS